MALCTITGTLLRPDGSVASLAVLCILRAGIPNQVVTLDIRRFEASPLGEIEFTAIQGSQTYIQAEALCGTVSLNDPAGVRLDVPNEETAELGVLISSASVPSQGMTIQDEGVALSTGIGTIDFVGNGVEVTQTAPGAAQVEVTGASRFQDLTDVDFASFNDGDIAQWDVGAGEIKGQTVASALGYTAEDAANKSTDPSLGTSNTLYPSQGAVKAYVDALLAAQDALIFKGVIDCSANPNYPAADAGHVYKISVAGKIGGASGVNVEISDTLYCITDGSAAGTQAAVGANWVIVQANIDGAVIGPTSVISGNLASFNGTTGKIIQDGAVAVDTDGTLAANSDLRIATQKATRTYIDANSSSVPRSYMSWPSIGPVTFRRLFSENLENGTSDIYTAPANTRALIGPVEVFNGGVATVIWSAKVKISGNYFRLRINVSTASGARGSTSNSFVLEPGESFAITADNAGLNLGVTVLEYPSSVPVYSPRITSVINGFNTIYTVPANTKAATWHAAFSGGTPFVTQGFHSQVWNNTGAGSINYTSHFVKSGSSPSATTKTAVTQAVGNDAIQNSFDCPSFLDAGDSLVMESNNGTDGQFIFTLVCEYT